MGNSSSEHRARTQQDRFRRFRAQDISLMVNCSNLVFPRLSGEGAHILCSSRPQSSVELLLSEGSVFIDLPQNPPPEGPICVAVCKDHGCLWNRVRHQVRRPR